MILDFFNLNNIALEISLIFLSVNIGQIHSFFKIRKVVLVLAHNVANFNVDKPFLSTLAAEIKIFILSNILEEEKLVSDHVKPTEAIKGYQYDQKSPFLFGLEHFGEPKGPAVSYNLQVSTVFN